jgi:hypothetical protein
MTLLELLRQELPKRGGWPEGYNYMTQDSRGSASAGKIYAYVNKPRQGVYYWINEDDNGGYGNFVMKSEIIAEDSITAIVTREQYEWDGTGLPPVGCECEYSLNSGRTWFKCKIDYILGTQGLIMLADVFEGGQWVSFHEYDDKLKFRPLRTEAERAIDEMVRLSGVSIGAAKILYDAGYRK